MAAIDNPAIDTRPIPEYKGRRAGDGVILEEIEPSFEPSRDRIVAIIPAYNEELFIGSVVLQTLQHASTVIVVDDGSSDLTAQIAQSAGAVVVQHEHNQGKGASLNTGFKVARDYQTDAVVILDADGQHQPEELCGVVAPILAGEADMVIGSRYLEDTSEVPSHRIWGHWVFNLITRLGSGMTSSDSQSGYRAFSPRALSATDFSSAGFSVESEMQFIAKEHDLRLTEVSIIIQYPDKPKRNVLGHGLSVLNGVLRLIGQYRPLLFFGVPGMFLLLVGFVWGWRVVDLYQRFGNLAVGYAMISVLLVIMGSLGLTTGIILHSMRGLLLDLLKPRHE